MYVPRHFLVVTHDTQSIGITSTNEEVCVMFRFFTNTNANTVLLRTNYIKIRKKHLYQM